MFLNIQVQGSKEDGKETAALFRSTNFLEIEGLQYHTERNSAKRKGWQNESYKGQLLASDISIDE